MAEPLKKWEDCIGHDLLKLKYEENEKYEFMFQAYANITRLEQLNQVCNETGIKFMERSIHSSYQIFVKNSYETKNMDNLTHFILKESHDIYTSGALKSLTSPDMVIYIKSTPEICLNRLRKSDRNAEQTVGLEFLKQIHEKHEQWLNVEESINKLGCPIIIINGDQTKEQIQNEATEILKEIFKLAVEKKVIEHLSELCNNLSINSTGNNHVHNYN